MGLRLRINGVMSPVVRNALRDFQQQEGLPVDGIAGPETEKALIGAKASVGGGIQYKPDTQSQDNELDVELDEEVQRNSREYIRWVQDSLNRILRLRLAVDGISGPMTRSAVRSFQARQGLVVDGIVGPQTEQALIAAGVGNPPGLTIPSYPSPGKVPSGRGSRTRLAVKILNSDRIELWPYSPTGGNDSDGADAFSNISETAQGLAAKRSSYGNAPSGSVYLDTRLLNGILSLSNTYGMAVTSIAGGSHSPNSRHYAGIACDVGSINGMGVSASNPYVSSFMQKCRDLGADQILGPGSAGHDRHVHLAWPRA
jgi:peptidoglycan hydrolase-like protein with peptidoglycan-binding domain